MADAVGGEEALARLERFADDNFLPEPERGEAAKLGGALRHAVDRGPVEPAFSALGALYGKLRRAMGPDAAGPEPATAADALHPLPYISRDQQAAEQGRARTEADHKRIGERIDATLRARRGERVVDEAAAAASLTPDPAEMDVSDLVFAAFPEGPGTPTIGWDGEAIAPEVEAAAGAFEIAQAGPESAPAHLGGSDPYSDPMFGGAPVPEPVDSDGDGLSDGEETGLGYSATVLDGLALGYGDQIIGAASAVGAIPGAVLGGGLDAISDGYAAGRDASAARRAEFAEQAGESGVAAAEMTGGMLVGGLRGMGAALRQGGRWLGATATASEPTLSEHSDDELDGLARTLAFAVAGEIVANGTGRVVQRIVLETLEQAGASPERIAGVIGRVFGRAPDEVRAADLPPGAMAMVDDSRWRGLFAASREDIRKNNARLRHDAAPGRPPIELHAHHPWPIYLQGPLEQQAEALTAGLHGRIHSVLFARLQTRLEGIGAPTVMAEREWADFMEDDANRDAVLVVLQEVSAEFDAYYGTALLPAVDREIRRHLGDWG